MSRRIVIKLGSSVVAAEGDVLHRICGVVADIHGQGREIVMVSSGAIARGVSELGLPGRPVAIEELQAASAVGQGKLYRVYDELLRGWGVRSAQVLLTFADISVRSHYLNARQTLSKLLDWRVVPVINENDTTATDEISFGDNDLLAAQVAVLTGADLLVLLTDIDGLYTADPRHDPHAQLIGEVADFEQLSQLQIGHSTSPLGTGGMRSKVLAAEMATAAGIRTVICNGIAEEPLRQALAGELVGTSFPPRASRYSSFKLWLRYAKPSHGSVSVDDGAAKALRQDGTSLLPVGIVDVKGSFLAGDAVEIVSDGITIGKGITNYAAEEMRRIMGRKTAAVREVLPEAVEEAIHRDYMVIGQ